jgi:hypothetical protein
MSDMAMLRQLTIASTRAIDAERWKEVRAARNRTTSHLLPSRLDTYRFARQPEIKSFSALPALIDYG